jgi:hypothetical protein
MEIAQAHTSSFSSTKPGNANANAKLSSIPFRLHVSETTLNLTTLIHWSREGKLIEAFGVGTAAILAPIGVIGFEGGESELPSTEGHTHAETHNHNHNHANGVANANGNGNGSNGIDPPSSLTDVDSKKVSGVSEKEMIEEGGKISLPVYEKGIGPVSSALRERVLGIQEGRVGFAGVAGVDGVGKGEGEGEGVGEEEWSVECV